MKKCSNTFSSTEKGGFREKSDFRCPLSGDISVPLGFKSNVFHAVRSIDVALKRSTRVSSACFSSSTIK